MKIVSIVFALVLTLAGAALAGERAGAGPALSKADRDRVANLILSGEFTKALQGLQAGKPLGGGNDASACASDDCAARGGVVACNSSDCATPPAASSKPPIQLACTSDNCSPVRGNAVVVSPLQRRALAQLVRDGRLAEAEEELRKLLARP